MMIIGTYFLTHLKLKIILILFMLGLRKIKNVMQKKAEKCFRGSFLEHTNSVTETSAFVTKKSSKFDYGSSLVVELPNSSMRFGDSTEIISVELDSNSPNVWNWASSKIKETSTSSTAQSLNYKGIVNLQKI